MIRNEQETNRINDEKDEVYTNVNQQELENNILRKELREANEEI